MRTLLAALALFSGADPADRLERTAVKLWGPVITETCPAGFSYVTEPMPEGTMGYVRDGAPCTVFLNSAEPLLGRWPALCDTVLHEAGHLAGFSHEHHGHDRIMRPNLILRDVAVASRSGRRTVRWRGVSSACFRQRPANMAVKVGATSPRMRR